MNIRNRNASLPLLKIDTDQPQKAKSKLALPDKAQPGRSRSKWSILAQNKPEAELFASDEKRSIDAYNALEKLASESGVGDKGIDTLNACRTSDYYLDIKNKLERNQKLVLSEYLYYALTTDNVNNINIEMLEAATKRKDAHGFEDNLQVLLAARKWQNATDPNEKKALNINLHKAFTQRGYLDRPGYRRCEYFLNLHGIDLSGADLTFAGLDYADLANANLSGCDIGHAHIRYSNINHANFKHAFANSPGNIYTESATRIEYTSALDALFDDFKADNISLKNSDFTGSSFTNSDLGIGISYDNDTSVLLDFVNFSGAKIHFTKQREDAKSVYVYMRFTNMTNCMMHNADCSRINLCGALLFPKDVLIDHDKFKLALTEVGKRLVEPITTEEHSPKEIERRIFCMKQSIAGVLVDQIDDLSQTMGDTSTLLKIALEDPTLGRLTTSILPAQIGTLFSSVSTKVFGATKPVENSSEYILEKELNRLAGLQMTTKHSPKQ